MEKNKIIVFFALGFILLTTVISAYQSCNGEYSPYPVKCQGGPGAGYTADAVASTTSTQPVNIWLVVSIILAIIIFWLLSKRRFR